jgi:hypothetical protein
MKKLLSFFLTIATVSNQFGMKFDACATVDENLHRACAAVGPDLLKQIQKKWSRETHLSRIHKALSYLEMQDYVLANVLPRYADNVAIYDHWRELAEANFKSFVKFERSDDPAEGDVVYIKSNADKTIEAIMVDIIAAGTQTAHIPLDKVISQLSAKFKQSTHDAVRSTMAWKIVELAHILRDEASKTLTALLNGKMCDEPFEELGTYAKPLWLLTYKIFDLQESYQRGLLDEDTHLACAHNYYRLVINEYRATQHHFSALKDWFAQLLATKLKDIKDPVRRAKVQSELQKNFYGEAIPLSALPIEPETAVATPAPQISDEFETTTKTTKKKINKKGPRRKHQKKFTIVDDDGMPSAPEPEHLSASSSSSSATAPAEIAGKEPSAAASSSSASASSSVETMAESPAASLWFTALIRELENEYAERTDAVVHVDMAICRGPESYGYDARILNWHDDVRKALEDGHYTTTEHTREELDKIIMWHRVPLLVDNYRFDCALKTRYLGKYGPVKVLIFPSVLEYPTNGDPTTIAREYGYIALAINQTDKHAFHCFFHTRSIELLGKLIQSAFTDSPTEYDSKETALSLPTPSGHEERYTISENEMVVRITETATNISYVLLKINAFRF